MREFSAERDGRGIGATAVVMTLTDWKEFHYWLFKQRVANSLKERLASDTQKGLDMLRLLRGAYPAGHFDTLRGYSE